MICKICNTLNSNDALNCINCGEKIEKKLNPFVPRSPKVEMNEIMLEKTPKIVAKKAPSQLTAKFKKDYSLLTIIYTTVILVLLAISTNIISYRIFEIPILPIINLSVNITETIGISQPDNLDTVLVADIIPMPSKKVFTVRKTPVLVIKPAEIKKDKVMEYYINPKDSMKMILIPAGETEIGSDNEGENEKPLHRSFVSSFFMDQHEITNRQYRKFVMETGYRMPKFIKDSRFSGPEQPVVGISYEDALAYARWTGKRLPTEIEWERAARAGQNSITYTNGNKLTPNMACYDLSPESDGPSDVKSYAYNRYFIYDLTGNASEWTSSVPSAYPGGQLTQEYGSNYRVIKGGCWKNIAADVTIAKRDIKGIKWSGNDIGFRCVMDN